MVDSACRRVLRNLHQILEPGRIRGDFCKEIQAHLNRCPSCARRHREVLELAVLCAQMPPPELSTTSKKTLLKKLRASLKPRG